MTSLRLPSLLCTALLLAATQPAPAAEQTMIVLDGSGSMWGQIDGRPKLEIARETLRTVLAETPAGTELGLLAYGHREKGNCKDIELVVPVAAGTGPAIAAAADRMKFLGMTPLSDAVTLAARELRYTERKATVILITDGLETCNADPCAVGKALEESGVDFTAHVVGFGLSEAEGKQVACLAENTGGRYFSASDATSLAAALTETVVEAPPPPPLPDASLDAPESVPTSSRVLVGWSGPGGKLDDVQLFDPAARDGTGRIVDSRRLQSDRGFDQRQATLVAPAVPGEYQLRYFHGEQRKVIATRALRVTQAEVGLEAPEEAAIASRVTVRWTGPGAVLDDLQLFDPRARDGSGQVLTSRRLHSDKGFEKREATVVAPAVPGDYELRYWNGDNRTVLATRVLRVIEADVGLEAPDQAPIASRVTARWTGPGGVLDDLQLFDPRARNGEGQVLTSRRLHSDNGFEQRQATVVAPAVPGDYELRYWNGDNRTVLATRPLRVVAAEVALDAPASVPAASRITVTWTGPGAVLDDVVLHDPRARNGDGMDIDRRRVRSDRGYEQRQASVVAPAVPGTYELRYWNGDNRRVLATRPIEVTAIEVRLEAPGRAAVDTPITVSWVGPGANLDNIEIHDPAARNGSGQVLVSRRLTSDRGYAERQATLRTPKVPGRYELRYWNGDNRAVLATRPLVVE